jgi:hypothetical protein
MPDGSGRVATSPAVLIATAGLIGYLRDMVRMSSRSVRSVDSYESRVWVGHRAKIEAELKVTPVLVDYWYIGSLFRQSEWDERQKDYLMRRGMFDDWWMRTRPEGEDKGPPTVQTGGWKRGYVEVTP